MDLLEELGEGGIEAVECAVAAERTRGLERRGRSKRAGIEPRVEHRELSAERGDAVAMRLGHAFDEAVETQPAQIVRHRSSGVGREIAPLELRDLLAERRMPKAGRREREETERVHQRVDAAIAEPETGGSLISDDDGGRDGVQPIVPDQAVVAQ